MKKKYILYDKNFNILVLYKTDDKRNVLIVPTRRFSNIPVEKKYGYKNLDIVPSIISDENAILMQKRNKVIKRYKTVNNKLVLTQDIREREYYSMPVEFDEELLNEILAECEDKGFIPKVMSIQDVENLIENEDVQLDPCVLENALKLEIKERVEC